MNGRLPALLVLLVVLAGCGGTAAPTPTEATVTPAPLPTDDGGELAPGVTGDGVEDPGTLARAHAARLADRSYTLVATRTVHYPNGTLRERLRLNLSLGANRSYLVHTDTEGPRAPVFLGIPPASAAFWSNSSTYTRRLTRDGATTYNSFQPTDGAGTWQYWARTVPHGGRGGNPRGFLTRAFSAVPTRTTARVSDGETAAFLIRGDGVTDRIELEVADPREVDLQATVTAAGLVRSLSLTYVGTIDGERVVVERHYRYRNVGNTTVERPGWVDRALGQEAAD
jgi:hypothetical protein